MKLNINTIIKSMLGFSISFFLTSIIFGVSVIENKQLPINTTVKSSSGISSAISGGIGMGLFLGIFVGVVIVGIWLIIRNIKNNERKHNDLLYGKYKIELDKCLQNRDSRLKTRNWKTFFLTFKRADLLLDTTDGLKKYAYYEGEMIQKDKYLLIAIYRITGLFTRAKDIIIIPYQIRKVVRKELINSKYVMIIKTESIDEALNTDFYSQCIFKDDRKDNELISFNDYIQKTYMEVFVLRQTIKDNLLDYKNTMDKAIEMNPNIQYERKNPKN